MKYPTYYGPQSKNIQLCLAVLPEYVLNRYICPQIDEIDGTIIRKLCSLTMLTFKKVISEVNFNPSPTPPAGHHKLPLCGVCGSFLKDPIVQTTPTVPYLKIIQQSVWFVK